MQITLRPSNAARSGHGYQIITFLTMLIVSCSIGSTGQISPPSTPIQETTSTPVGVVISLAATIDIPPPQPTETAIPTVTRPPTETPSPTPEPSPTETPTTRAPDVPLEVQLYGQRIGSALANFTKKMNRFSALLSNGSLTEDEQLTQLKKQIVQVRLAHDILPQIVSPAEVETIHQAILEATGNCRTAVDLVAADIDDNNMLDDLEPALAPIGTCAEKLSAVMVLEQNYLTQLSTGISESPTVTPLPTATPEAAIHIDIHQG